MKKKKPAKLPPKGKIEEVETQHLEIEEEDNPGVEINGPKAVPLAPARGTRLVDFAPELTGHIDLAIYEVCVVHKRAFTNRETFMVLTKLQEALHWARQDFTA